MKLSEFHAADDTRASPHSLLRNRRPGMALCRRCRSNARANRNLGACSRAR